MTVKIMNIYASYHVIVFFFNRFIKVECRRLVVLSYYPKHVAVYLFPVLNVDAGPWELGLLGGGGGGQHHPRKNQGEGRLGSTPWDI